MQGTTKRKVKTPKGQTHIATHPRLGNIYYAPHCNIPGSYAVYCQAQIDYARRLGLGGYPVFGTYKTIKGAIRRGLKEANA